jgi:hypothetical protein
LSEVHFDDIDVSMDRSLDQSLDAPIDGRWLTYKELADIRHISVASALSLVTRQRRLGKPWQRQRDNHGQMRVLVPARFLATDTSMDATIEQSMAPSRDASIDISSAIKPLADAVNTLREQLTAANASLAAANERADRADAAVAGERERADALRAEMQAKSEALQAEIARLQAAEAERRQLGLPARLMAALRRR